MSLTAVVRYAGTAALTGLTAAFFYYPHAYWIPVAVAVLGTLGYHVVPTAGQQQEPPKQ
jgi:hypothetical protein